MSAKRKRDVQFRPTLGCQLESREAAANLGGMRMAVMSAFLAQRQAAFEARAAARAWRPFVRANVSTGLLPAAYRPNGPTYYVAPGPTSTPLGELDNYYILR